MLLEPPVKVALLVPVALTNDIHFPEQEEAGDTNQGHDWQESPGSGNCSPRKGANQGRLAAVKDDSSVTIG